MPESISLAKQVVATEIRALEAMNARVSEDFGRTVKCILNMKGRLVVVGMGKSGLIGRKIAATMASTGTPAFSVHAGEAFHGDLGMIRPTDVVLMISNSGETEELVRLLPFLKHQNNYVIAMTGKPASTLGKSADTILDISVEREACNNNLAPTSSTTAALVMGDALAVVLASKRGFQPEDFARFHPGGSLGRSLLMRVADVMHKGALPVCTAQTCFKDVVHVVNRGRMGLALVMQGDRLLGIITDGDIRRGFDTVHDYRSILAEDLMSTRPKAISPDARVGDAEALLRQEKIGALVVQDIDGRVIGIFQMHNAEEAPGVH
ncbi:KpsF/GutQ family sugar-phosphate isomerase [Cupriavidus metallidurans]|uniref:KpsF/GutQ family sugar-phosphate isomerase n=1 Tax=Cupriavidus TaxID=106589 RepID=UPI002580AE3B|nr:MULTISPECIES: KpsF/GutQ family sugar-phosphate isomerase [unclassified Cupriavidus]GMG92812.1 D-arabinose 5-phosphate isomerase [Cupriavidus sp. TKC]